MKPVFSDPFLHPDLKWEMIRASRDADLSASDYAVMPDYPLDDQQKNQVLAYRKGLRDIPEQGDDPDAVAWPDKPAFLR